MHTVLIETVGLTTFIHSKSSTEYCGTNSLLPSITTPSPQIQTIPNYKVVQISLKDIPALCYFYTEEWNRLDYYGSSIFHWLEKCRTVAQK